MVKHSFYSYLFSLLSYNYTVSSLNELLYFDNFEIILISQKQGGRTGEKL